MKLLESKQYREDLQKAIQNIDLSILDGKTVFITGGLGLIGSTVVDILICFGRTTVYVGARDYQQFKERFGGYDKIRFVQYDALAPLNLEIKPDYIIHSAGLSSPELYTSMPIETILSNFDGLHSLLEYSKENEVSRMLYVSSSEVYGKKELGTPFSEDTYGIVNIDDIRSSYAVAKKASEMLCRAYMSEQGVETIIVRPGHIYGPSAKRTDRRISSDFVFKAAKGEKLEMKSAGLQKRSYCYSIDCAIQILTALLKGEAGQAYNVGNDAVTTIREMAEICADVGNVELTVAKPTETELHNFNPMNNSALDNRKIKKLGYRDTFSVKEGLWHTVEILKEISTI